MRKLLTLSLIPHIVIDIIGWILFSFVREMDITFKVGSYILLSQYVLVLPLYHIATLAVFHFKYKLDVLKGFILQLVVIYISKLIFVAIASVFMYFMMGKDMWSFSEAMKFAFEVESTIACLLPALAIMLPGTIIIAVVSYVRKKKQITADRNDTEE